MTSARDKYAADQARLQQERSGLAEHTVSVSSTVVKTGSMYANVHVARCTCKWRYHNVSLERCEELALKHRQNAPEGPQEPQPAPVAPESTQTACEPGTEAQQ